MTRLQGTPCWYELSTSEGHLGAAEEFYGAVLGWTFDDSGMEGFTYHLASASIEMVSGLMVTPSEAAGVPPHWLIYFAVEDADASATAIRAAGGRIVAEPADVPGTGRFAVAFDPQGACFGILEPAPMDGQRVAGGAFDQQKPGHGNWNELMTSDPVAGLAFYADLFGWQKSQTVDMGEMGRYQLFSHEGADIGAVMGLGQAPVPNWLPYFGVTGVDVAVDRIKAGGGRLAHGPAEVPGGAFIAIAQDPQGAWFAVVGPKDAAA